VRSIFLAVPLVLTASCSAPNSDQPPNDIAFSEPQALADQAVKDAQAFSQIAIACKASNFGAFLSHFANSPNIRESYSAREITYKLGNKSARIPANEYYQFPFVQTKGSWIGTSGFEIEVRVQDLKATPVIVNWSYVPLDPTITYTDADLELVQGKGGQLEFRLFKGCWRLMSDTRSYDPQKSPFK
jgi:hypothetical protein